VDQGSKEWFRRAAVIVAIVSNNIFQVKDSLSFIKSGDLDKKRFFATDPTGHNQVVAKDKQKEILDRIQKEFKKAKPSVTIAPFFVKKEAAV
jgi:hypothetical protein